MVKSGILTEEISDLQRLFSIAIKSANSQSIDGADRCFDILHYLKNLSFSAKDLDRVSIEIAPLASLRDHTNPKIRMEAKELFNSWMKALNSRDPSTCNNTKLLKKPAADHVAKVVPDLKKNIVNISVTTRGNAGEIKKKPEFSGMKKTEDQRSKVHQVCENKQKNLNKTNDRKSFAAKRPMQEKKQSALSMKLSEEPRSLVHEAVEIKQQNSKKPVTSIVPAVTKNSTETLELFEIAKKSADVASAKGILFSKEETSICVDTLTLLIDYPISSTAPETKRIMEKLSYLTKHKDRKICNSATSLLQHWSRSITDQQHRDALKTQG